MGVPSTQASSGSTPHRSWAISIPAQDDRRVNVLTVTGVEKEGVDFRDRSWTITLDQRGTRCVRATCCSELRTRTPYPVVVPAGNRSTARGPLHLPWDQRTDGRCIAHERRNRGGREGRLGPVAVVRPVVDACGKALSRSVRDKPFRSCVE